MNERIARIYEKYSNRFSAEIPAKGALYIVSVPIGNIADISFRALEILKQADFIAAEDTRVTGSLLAHLGIRNRIVSYYSQTEQRKLDTIISCLESGQTGALVSDAGTPCISDPGNLLVSECIRKSIEVYSVPGCSALIHALAVSGFPNERFYFQGFLPLKKNRKSVLEELSRRRMTIVIYESPYRIMKTLAEISDKFGNREIAVSRELTKKFEQTVRGSAKDLIRKGIRAKGEFVITINNN